MSRLAMVSALLLAMPVAIARVSADSPHAIMAVSVQVVRSCQVQSGGGNTTLECGQHGPAAVEVSVDGKTPSLRTLHGTASRQPSTVASTPDGTRTLTINF